MLTFISNVCFSLFRFFCSSLFFWTLSLSLSLSLSLAPLQDSEKEGERLRYEETLTPAERAIANADRKKTMVKLRAKAEAERREFHVPVLELEVAYSRDMRCKVRKDRILVAEAVVAAGARFISRADIQHVVRTIKSALAGSVPPKRFR